MVSHNYVARHLASGTDETMAPLFGSIGELDSLTLTVMIIIIVTCVLSVEHTFDKLRKLTNETPFRHILATVEQELMVVGFTAFVFKIIFSNNNFLNFNQFLALEFADLLVPVFSICNCIIGIVLIMISLVQCNIWSKAFHLKLDQLTEEFLDFVKGRHFR